MVRVVNDAYIIMVVVMKLFRCDYYVSAIVFVRLLSVARYVNIRPKDVPMATQLSLNRFILMIMVTVFIFC